MPIQVGSVTLDLKGWLALALFIFQNGCAALIMRYSKVMGLAPYDSSVAVLLQEVAVKLPICMVLYAVECGGSVAAESRPPAALPRPPPALLRRRF